MDSTKKIARDMLDAINLDDSGLLVNFTKGFISFSVSMAYLSYDYIDTQHRGNNSNDKYRIAELVKRGVFRKEIVEKVVSVFIDDFTSRINFEKVRDVADKTGANIMGRLSFSHLTGINLGRALTANVTHAIFAGTIIGSLLYPGSEASRAIYTARNLESANPVIYSRLRRMGDLDLLYFIVKDTVAPFERACDIHKENPPEFDELCRHFFNGLKG